MAFLRIEEIIEKMNLTALTPEIGTADIKVRQAEVNRPALELTGYFDHFAPGRIQIIGLGEYSYIQQMTEEHKEKVFDKLFSQEVPMIIFTRGLMPDDHILEIARRHNKPMYMTSQATSPFMAEMLRWLNVKLAPCISVHGVLVDVYGVGLLLTGDSGVGKSEAALELIKRGHRLVSDDVVEIRRVSEVTLIGTAPAITKHFIELRGIGIIDVKTLSAASATARPSTWRSTSRSGTGTASTTGWVWRKIIQSIWATAWCVTACLSVPEEMSPSSASPRRPTTGRR